MKLLNAGYENTDRPNNGTHAIALRNYATHVPNDNVAQSQHGKLVHVDRVKLTRITCPLTYPIKSELCLVSTCCCLQNISDFHGGLYGNVGRALALRIRNCEAERVGEVG